MGLFEKAIETYDAMSHLAGKEVEGKNEILAPIGHLTTKAQIMITLDYEGNFIQADKVDFKIIIPVTEESSGRTSAPAAHALDDQLSYLLGYDANKRSLYTSQLHSWADSKYSSPKLTAILKYVESGRMFDDLSKADLLKMDANGKISNEKDLVCWTVLGTDESVGPVWKDTELMSRYASYYVSSRCNDENVICMLTGEETIPATQHLKGVFSLNGNAKLISSNDSQNFTYRGRFTSDNEAATVGYISSQKAHNVLKWIIGNDGVTQGGRAFICWNPHGISIPKVSNPLIGQSNSKPKPSEYKKLLNEVILGYKNMLPIGEDVITAAFDAATTGRLAVTYYSELQARDFLDRIQYWDETCCWYDNSWGTRSPSLFNLVNYAFGVQHGQKIETDDRVIAQHIQRLIACRLERAVFPRDIMLSLVRKSGNMQVYESSNRRNLLFAACAAIRKYRSDIQKEEIEMALEAEKQDRSYQFGRLLAIMEKIESDTYDKDETRETNAIRMQSVFVQRPGYASKIIMDQLKNAYYPRLKPGQRVYYDRLIGDIMEQISHFEDDFNKPLTEMYLPGYYLQKNALYAKKQTEEKVEENKDEA